LLTVQPATAVFSPIPFWHQLSLVVVTIDGAGIDSWIYFIEHLQNVAIVPTTGHGST
jgi:hypothetical protein